MKLLKFLAGVAVGFIATVLISFIILYLSGEIVYEM